MIFLFAACLVLLTTSKTTKPDSSSQSQSAEDEATNLKTNSKKSFDLEGRLRLAFALEAALLNPKGDFVCSPISALLPLGKLAMGSEDTALKELLEAIGIQSKPQLKDKLRKLINDLQQISGVRLDIASRLYIDLKQDLNEKFIKDTKNIFKSAVRKINFGNPNDAVGTINDWVSDQTKGMIPEILVSEDIDASTSLVMINAIYFRGNWLYPFEKTKAGSFSTPRGLQTVLMMNRIAKFKYINSDVLKAEIVEIPYQSQNASFIIILPRSKDGLHVLLRQLKLDPETLNSECDKMIRQPVDLTIPKFKAGSNLNLRGLYEKIGIKNIFDQKNSRISGIVKNDKVFVSKAIQKAVIEINEKGSKAAAASAANIAGLSYQKPISININHTLLFLVKSNSQRLFAGVSSSLSN